MHSQNVCRKGKRYPARHQLTSHDVQTFQPWLEGNKEKIHAICILTVDKQPGRIE